MKRNIKPIKKQVKDVGSECNENMECAWMSPRLKEKTYQGNSQLKEKWKHRT